jgi:hypothetical protein
MVYERQVCSKVSRSIETRSFLDPIHYMIRLIIAIDVIPSISGRAYFIYNNKRREGSIFDSSG